MTATGPAGRGSNGLFAAISVVIFAAALFVGGTALFDLGFYSRYRLPGMSMEPTIKHGSELWARPADRARISDGEIVLLRPPASAEISSLVVTRVVAIAGQTVAAHDGQVLVNGLPSGKAPPFPSAIPEITVPPSTVYVLGDNRANSIGSNRYGPVPVGRVVRRVVRTNASSTRALIARAGASLMVAAIAAMTCWSMLRRRRSRSSDPGDPTDQPPRPLWDDDVG